MKFTIGSKPLSCLWYQEKVPNFSSCRKLKWLKRLAVEKYSKNGCKSTLGYTFVTEMPNSSTTFYVNKVFCLLNYLHRSCELFLYLDLVTISNTVESRFKKDFGSDQNLS